MRMAISYPWRYAAFLAAYYISNALYQGYAALYLNAVGLDARQIGLIQSALPVCAVFALLAWGGLSDRSRNRARTLQAAALLSALSMGLMGGAAGLPWLLLSLGLFNLCFPALQPMGDSIILEALGRRPFGPLRMSASLAFALGSLLFGYLLESRVRAFPLATCAMMMLVAAAAQLLPFLPGRQRPGHTLPLRAFWALPGMKGLLSLFILLQLTMGYYFSFFPLYFTALPGGNKRLLGYAYLIGTLSELPFLGKGDRLYARLGAERLLLCSAGVLTLRWALLAALPGVFWALIGQLLHAGGFIVLSFAMAKRVSQAVPEELRARGQALVAVAGYGAARVAGNLLGAWIAGAYGTGAGFWYAAAVCLSALLGFGPYYLRKANQV
ncbi:MFS transporter [Bacillota bacterium Meth-B3]